MHQMMDACVDLQCELLNLFVRNNLQALSPQKPLEKLIGEVLCTSSCLNVLYIYRLHVPTQISVCENNHLGEQFMVSESRLFFRPLGHFLQCLLRFQEPGVGLDRPWSRCSVESYSGCLLQLPSL